MATVETQELGFLKSKFPVLLPAHSALTLPNDQFDAFIKKDLERRDEPNIEPKGTSATDDDDDSETLVSAPSTTGELREQFEKVNVAPESKTAAKKTENDHPFMKALNDNEATKPRNMENKMLTENADIAHRSTGQPLVDLFSELEDVVSGPRLRELLEAAWQDDALATLKIIFNARSIHLGKSSRATSYRCFGWLAQNHPLTLVANLQWLSRPVIEKKVEKKENVDDDLVLVEPEKDDDDPSRFDVKNGVAHGYWKDLLNLLAICVSGKLNVLSDPSKVLNVKNTDKPKERNWDAEAGKRRREEKRDNRYQLAVKAFERRPVYRVLHLTVARLFAEQLKSDLALLQDKDLKARRKISLCAKWAPSSKCFHDQHTFVVSSIAEIMHPQTEFADVKDRETYLRHAREAYRKDVSALRKQLEIVERDISAKTFNNIKYDRLPSLAMNQYASLFAKKDYDRFDSYISKVAEGKKQISGAVLFPSTLIHNVRKEGGFTAATTKRAKPGSAKALLEQKLADIDAKVADGQWRALVQRIKDSGTLDSSIAVCDVSGSMGYPNFPDGTTPMDSAIALSLLVSEVTAPPFGGNFITFSEHPQVQAVDLTQTLKQKVSNMESSSWGMSTNFEAVFIDLILPRARKHKLKQEDMVKQVFVFSDMQFNAARHYDSKWSTSYERIQKEYKRAGYEMPKLIFWNLAGGRAGYSGGSGRGDPVAPKPVTSDETGTALVSGYSQGMLKVFLDNGSFEDPEEEEEIVQKEEADGTVKVEKQKKETMNPLSTMKKAISHKAYSMLQVVD